MWGRTRSVGAPEAPVVTTKHHRALRSTQVFPSKKELVSAAHDTTRPNASAGASRQLRLLQREHGFLLVEALVAMVVFAIVATGIVDMLVSSTSITTLAKQRTLAEQGVSNQIEYIRSIDYPSLGTVGGNPSGTVPQTQVFDGVNNETLGVPATLTTSISYASADVPGSALTGADEKQVTVTITRTSDSQVLAQAVTYVAPKKQSSQTTGGVEATVTDIGNNQSQSGTVLDNVNVTLTPPVGLNPAIPSGPESDLTDASGTVTFPGLTPTSGSQLYTVGIAAADLPAFYTQLPVAGFPLSPTEISPQSIQVYQPVTLYVALDKPDGTNWVGTASITVTAGSGGTSHTFSNISFTSAGTPYAITTLSPPSGQLLLPNIDYSITVQGPSGYAPVTDDEVVPVAGSYPASAAATLTTTFTETMTPPVMGTLDVSATRLNSGNPVACSGATITVKDNSGTTVATGPTPTTGTRHVQFAVPVTAAPYTVTAVGGGSPARTGSVTNITPVANPTLTPVAVALSGTSTTGTTC